MSAYILAHDLGTTGDKATLFLEDGSVAASVFASYPTAYPHQNWVEQNPEDWRQALFGTTRRLLSESSVRPQDIAAVSFSGHMNGALLVDAAGKPLRPAIIWADQRATAQETLIRSAIGAERVYQITGNRISPAYTAAKLAWIKENQPDIYQQARYALQAKDYAAFLFSGAFATDPSDASMTLLFDLEKRQWSPEIVKALDLNADLLPPIHPSATIIGHVTKEAAAASHLLPGTPVVIGGGDGACATVGAGSVTPGDAYNYIGSSSWVALTTPEPALDPAQRTFNIAHLVPESNIALGAMQAAGGAFDWFEQLMRRPGVEQPDYRALDAAAALVPPGSRRLLFLPYLRGERSPHWNPLARGAFIGLTMSDGRGEMARAVLEGVAFNLRAILDILRSQGLPIEAMRLIGGGGKSVVWRQILADSYRLPVQRLALSAEATALGAAIAGGVGVGLYPDFSVARAMIPITETVLPEPKAAAAYDTLFEIFMDAYAALEPIFERLNGDIGRRSQENLTQRRNEIAEG